MTKPTRTLIAMALSSMLMTSGIAGAGGFLPEEGTAGRSAARSAETSQENQYGLVFFGDMAIRPDQLNLRGFSGRKWQDGVLPIRFAEDVAPENQQRFLAACSEWTMVANVRCVLWSGQASHIHVLTGQGNWSEVGRQIDENGTGREQLMSISDWWRHFTIVHEIGHALGLSHEQSRPDRNRFVEIIENAIQPGSEHNFKIMPMRTFTPYDFDSVMHYPSRAFGKPNPNTGQQSVTIRPRSGFETAAQGMGQRQFLSDSDGVGMAAQYGPPLQASPIAAFEDGTRSRSETSPQPKLPLALYPPYQKNAEAMRSDAEIKVFGGEFVTTASYNATMGIAAAGQDLVDCTGTLIADDKVLTARHCACDGIHGRALVGNDETQGIWHEVASVAWPDDTKRCGPYADADNPDIVVLTLATKVPNATPRKLASAAQIDTAIDYRVVGFGRDESGNFGFKKRADVPSATNNCSGFVNGLNVSESRLFGCVPGAEIVAGRVGLGRDSCNGDSGGPLFLFPAGGVGVKDYLLAGATSRAARNSVEDCGDGGIYVRLTGKARAFVDEALR